MPITLTIVAADREIHRMSEYNYRSFPLDLDAETFSAFPSVLSAGGPAPDGELIDAHSGETVQLSELWKNEAVVIEFGSMT
jgi:hypothetical protein